MMDIAHIINKVKDRVPKPLEIKNEYAVVIPLIKVGENWSIIYEVRAKSLKRQPGEISFPGGKVENGESHRQAALREAMEELNLKEDNINIIGELDYLVARDNTTIYSFLAIIENMDINHIKWNKDEVDHIFTVPIEFLVANEPKPYYIELRPAINNDFPYNLIPNGKDYNWRTGKESVYFYIYKDYVIWGYTAKMTKRFIDIIKE